MVSNSWDGLEPGTTDFAAFQSVAIQAGLKGIGFHFASGDNGNESIQQGPNETTVVGSPTVETA